MDPDASARDRKDVLDGWFVDLLPDMNQENPLVAQYLIQNTIWWVQETFASQFKTKHRPRAILHFAAESHVDRSIAGPDAFVETNIVGTFSLLEQVKSYWDALPSGDKAAFRFLHVSTDEVYGTLGRDDPAFTRTPLTRLTALTPLRKLLPIIWFAPTFILTAFPFSPSTARINMVPSSFETRSQRTVGRSKNKVCWLDERVCQSRRKVGADKSCSTRHQHRIVHPGLIPHSG
jgi:hypothetical protein